MGVPLRIALVSEGDAETHHAFSGIAKYVVEHLRRHGHTVHTLNATPGGVTRLGVAAMSFHANRSAWRTSFRHGRAAFNSRSNRIRRLFGPYSGQVDVVLQVGPSMTPPGEGRIPYALLCDWNMALSIRFRDNPHSSSHNMRLHDAERINKRHGPVYRDAAAVFTLSNALRDSFIGDYGLDADRVLTVHAGPNLDISGIPTISPTDGVRRPPTILFSGKEFLRKGGDVLMDAFRIIRQQLGDARLRILGPRILNVDEPGVEFCGFLNKNDPREFHRLARLYSEADVFCLPTRLEPLGVVVLEAMHFGLPCVTSDVWALPEMVLDGETGYTVPPGDAWTLADRLLRLLRDPLLARRMGTSGRERARSLFTWEAATRSMSERLQTIVARSTRPAGRDQGTST